MATEPETKTQNTRTEKRNKKKINTKQNKVKKLKQKQNKTEKQKQMGPISRDSLQNNQPILADHPRM